MTLNIAIIGAGRIGKLHVDNLATRVPGVRVAGIADIALPAAQETAARLNIPKVSADYHDLLADKSIDAVAICSATDTHAQIIGEAADAGKHIFCEKPISFDLKAIDKALAAVKKAGVKLQIGFNRRFDPNFARVRQAVAQGEIGKLHFVHITSRDPAPPPISYVKASGGIFLDMTIHDFDMARYLVDDQVSEVYATASVRVDPAIGEAGDYDTVFVVLKFANGVVATIDNCRQAVYGYDQRVEAFGTAGSISTENQYPNTATIRASKSVYRDLPLYFFLERYMQSFVNELSAFVDAVANGKDVPVSGMDGRIPVVIGMAARTSAQENRPVKLSEIGA
jgi:myo-inositol 2-dehydrogenase/D-chiro-inositol 1-dehydrogenase